MLITRGDQRVQACPLQQRRRGGGSAVGEGGHGQAGPAQVLERGTGVGVGVQPGEGRQHRLAVGGGEGRCHGGQGAVRHLVERSVGAAGRQREPVTQQAGEQPLPGVGPGTMVLECNHYGVQGHERLHDVDGHGSWSLRGRRARCLPASRS